jgi:hypothetical protein
MKVYAFLIQILFFVLVFVLPAFFTGCNSGDPYEATPPKGLNIIKVVPFENETNVSITSDITVTFENEIKESTLTGKSFILSRAKSGTTVNGDIVYDAASKTAMISPYSNLLPGEDYEVVVNGVKGANDEYIPPHIFSFRTSSLFTVKQVNPVNNAKSVVISGQNRQEIYAVFSESVNEDKITTDNFYALEQGTLDPNAVKMNASIQYSHVENKLSLKPVLGRLKYSTKYFITLRDIESVTNARIDNVNWEFETDQIRVMGSIPSGTEDTLIATDTDITVYFQDAVDRNTVGGNIRLRKAFGAQDSFIFDSPPTYSSGDTQVTLKTVESEADTGLTTSTRYELSVDGVTSTQGEAFKSYRIYFTTASS